MSGSRGERPDFHGEVPDKMETQALHALLGAFPGAEREILAGYNGGDAVEKEKLLRTVLGRVYYEGYMAGAAGTIPEDASEWSITAIENDDEGENNA